MQSLQFVAMPTPVRGEVTRCAELLLRSIAVVVATVLLQGLNKFNSSRYQRISVNFNQSVHSLFVDSS